MDKETAIDIMRALRGARIPVMAESKPYWSGRLRKEKWGLRAVDTNGKARGALITDPGNFPREWVDILERRPA